MLGNIGKGLKLLKSLPLIIFLLKQVRVLIEEFEVPGEGEKKKEAVLKSLKNSYNRIVDHFGWDLVEWELVEGIVEPVIDLTVELLNLTLWSNDGAPNNGGE